MKLEVTIVMNNKKENTIIINAASSFVAYHVIEALLNDSNKYEVICAFKSKKNEYTERNKERIDRIIFKEEKIKASYGVKHHDFNWFNKVINGSKHKPIVWFHESWTKDYNKPNYNIENAIKYNTKNLNEIYKVIKINNGSAIYSSSYFQYLDYSDLNYTGYSLAKKITLDIHQYYAKKNNVELKEFIIYNPIGPYEPKKIVDMYLMAVKNKTDFKLNNENAKSRFEYVQDCAQRFLNIIYNDKNNEKPFVPKEIRVIDLLKNIQDSISNNNKNNIINNDKRDILNLYNEEYIKWLIINYKLE